MKAAVEPVRENATKDEPTNVRAREESPPSSRMVPAPAQRELRMNREHRIHDKVAEARLLLDKLPEGDSRRRLLLAAQARQDEVLLDAILSTLTRDCGPSR
ncbi:MAG TPA: hypothetical protein VFQ61_14260 [Polyangiaceae bacterium]|nr:hypothetical protein [Polyangiaceae bacterium]